MIDKFDTEATQGLFEIVHAKTFTPNPSPVIDVFANRELVITPLPEINDQVPIPTVAALAAIRAVGVLTQIV